MNLMRTKRLFCAAAVMTACTLYTAGFTSYAMSPDQGRDGGMLTGDESVLTDEIAQAMTASARQIAEEKKIQRKEELKAQAEAERQAEEARKAAEEAARQAREADQRLLAALIFCEAGNQPYEGQVAVGAVVLNRVNSGVYPGSIREVIYQSGQFGPAMTGWLDQVLANGSYTQTAMQAAADAMAGSDPVEQFYLSFNADMPGKILPPRKPKEAPPPVLIWPICSATPALCTAATESPPPIIE